ncbi:MAG: hypothetical protein QM613_00050 [Micrococcaceae bacterium]
MKLTHDYWKHISQRHPEITKEILWETLSDPDRVVLVPHPKSRTGQQYSVIGWSDNLEHLVIVIADISSNLIKTAYPVSNKSLVNQYNNPGGV